MKDVEGTVYESPEGGKFEVSDSSDLEIPAADLGPIPEDEREPEKEPHDDKAEPDVESKADDSSDGDAEYQPNFEYTVYEQKREFPEEYRRFITDKESEDAMRDLFTKADALDVMKEKRERAQKESEDYSERYSNLEKEYTKQNNFLDEMRYYRENNPVALAKFIGLSEDEVFDLANKLWDAKERPDVRQRLNESVRNTNQSFQHMNQTRQQTSQQSQYALNVHQQALNMAMSRPDVAEFAKDWDARTGQPGEFMRQVNLYGESASASTGRVLTPFEAVDYVYQTLTKAVGANAPSESAGRETSSTVRKPTLPRVGTGGGTATPMKRRFKDIDDYTNWAQEEAARLP